MSTIAECLQAATAAVKPIWVSLMLVSAQILISLCNGYQIAHQIHANQIHVLQARHAHMMILVEQNAFLRGRVPQKRIRSVEMFHAQHCVNLLINVHVHAHQIRQQKLLLLVNSMFANSKIHRIVQKLIASIFVLLTFIVHVNVATLRQKIVLEFLVGMPRWIDVVYAKERMNV